jgi:L-iditol 2-dehydrogenase
MDALVFRGPGALRLEQRPEPEPGPGEAVIRVDACGVCGTDLRIAAGNHRAYPEGTVRVPGHEIAGTLVAGSVDGLSPGQPVFVAPNVGCMQCDQCRAGRVNLCRTPQALGITRDGAFATHVRLDRDVIEQGNVLPVPEGTDPAAVSVAEPLACVLRGQRPCRIGEGDVVLVVGAGPIGLLHLLAARTRGPATIVVSEPGSARREQARALGADVVVDPATEDVADALRQVAPAGPDVVIVAAPVPAAQAEALELAAPGARINFFAGLARDRSRVELDTNLIHYKELVVTGTTACTTEDCREALELILSGAVDAAQLVTERRPLEEASAAFESAAAGLALKVVLEP